MELLKYEEIGKTSYYQLPKKLFTDKYKGMSLDAKVVYAFLRDRMILSLRNEWKDDSGYAYIIFRQSEIADLLDISLRTVKRIYAELRNFGLIKIQQQGMGKPSRVYIYKMDDNFDTNAEDNNNTTLRDVGDTIYRDKEGTSIGDKIDTAHGDKIDTVYGDKIDTTYGDTTGTSYKSETEYRETESNKTENREKEKRTLSYESVREKDADASHAPTSTEPATTCKPKKKRVAFVPPTYDEVREYCLLRNNDVDPERFIDYYESNGWLVGRNKMKDWKAAVRNWERREVNVRRPWGNQAANDKQEAISVVQRLAMKYAKEGINDG